MERQLDRSRPNYHQDISVKLGQIEARLLMVWESDRKLGQTGRSTPRVPFVASAKLLEVDTGTRMNAQVSELSLHGCYVDTLNPLPKGTSVYVKIFTEEYFFETPAIVVYTHAQLGMGLAFHDVKPNFVGVLQNWVMASTGKKGS